MVTTIVSPAAAAPTPSHPADLRARAAQGAAALVAQRPAFLHASAGDAFVQGAVVSTGPTQYVPYQRTHAGLAVVGGDFVLVTNADGTVVYHSAAPLQPI